MKTKVIFFISSFIFSMIISTSYAQDTFSIVAIDTITGEVGSAGASCVDMSNFPGYDDDFLGELFPALGAINTQAYYHPTNQANARERMNLGDTPGQIIDWLIENDVSGQPQIRQYGIVAMVDESCESAAHTGTSTNNYKNHVLGPNYSIQGNILLGQEILDSMEARFLNAQGDLACKLMAALQGANVVGADTRCSAYGTSSLFAFVKVAQPDDIFGEPSFKLSVRTSAGDNIEPIDSLQIMFDEVHDCFPVGTSDNEKFGSAFKVYPVPANDVINIESTLKRKCLVSLCDLMGNIITRTFILDKIELDISDLAKGVYLIKFSDTKNLFVKQVIIE